MFNDHIVGRTTTKKEQRSANTLYQELSFQDNDESEENEIVTGMYKKTIYIVSKMNVSICIITYVCLCK